MGNTHSFFNTKNVENNVGVEVGIDPKKSIMGLCGYQPLQIN